MQIHEKECKDQIHGTPKIDQAPRLEDNRHIGDGAEKYVSLAESDGDLLVNHGVGRPIDIGLVSNNYQWRT